MAAGALLLVLATTAQAQSSGGVGYNPGYYKPVTPQPQAGPPCGHYMTAPCPASPAQPPAAVDIPPGASADTLFDLGEKAFAARQFTNAAAYFQRAAEMGHIRAEAALGLMYVNGKGEPEDGGKAVYWLTKAADGGHRVAEAQLGEFYEHGINGVQVDIPKAIQYYEASAAQHWWLAEYSLALDYELGVGVQRNRATAIELFNRATSDGQDGLSQDLAAMLQRRDTPQFANVAELATYLNSLRGHPASGAVASNPLHPSPGQQYNLNRLRAPGNTCRGSVGTGCN